MAQDPPGTRGPQREWGCEQWAARAPWAGPHSEEQCGLTPACWPRAAAQGASAGTVTGCRAGGKDWPPGHGRRGCPGRRLGWPAGARRTPRGSPRTWRCCPTLTPSTKTPTEAEAPSNYLPDDASHFLQEKSQKADVIRGPLSM